MTAAAGSLEGLAAARQERPSTLAEATEALRRADRDGERVLFVGGGTELSLGAPPTGVEVVLATERLERIVEHAPLDQIVTVEAGVRLLVLTHFTPPPDNVLLARIFRRDMGALPPDGVVLGEDGTLIVLPTGSDAIEVTRFDP